jgi:hypothetical protein
MKSIIPYLLAVLLAAVVAADAFACPSCKDGIASDPNGANLAAGIEASIIFMLSMPFLILGGLGSYFYWEIRKAQKALERKQALEAAAALQEPASDIEQPEEELVGAP